jgi:hypothetical protein
LVTSSLRNEAPRIICTELVLVLLNALCIDLHLSDHYPISHLPIPLPASRVVARTFLLSSQQIKMRMFMQAKEFYVGFAVTFAMFYSIPVSPETRAASKFCNPNGGH